MKNYFEWKNNVSVPHYDNKEIKGVNYSTTLKINSLTLMKVAFPLLPVSFVNKFTENYEIYIVLLSII